MKVKTFGKATAVLLLGLGFNLQAKVDTRCTNVIGTFAKLPPKGKPGLPAVRKFALANDPSHFVPFVLRTKRTAFNWCTTGGQLKGGISIDIFKGEDITDKNGMITIPFMGKHAGGRTEVALKDCPSCTKGNARKAFLVKIKESFAESIVAVGATHSKLPLYNTLKAAIKKRRKMDPKEDFNQAQKDMISQYLFNRANEQAFSEGIKQYLKKYHSTMSGRSGYDLEGIALFLAGENKELVQVIKKDPKIEKFATVLALEKLAEQQLEDKDLLDASQPNGHIGLCDMRKYIIDWSRTGNRKELRSICRELYQWHFIKARTKTLRSEKKPYVTIRSNIEKTLGRSLTRSEKALIGKTMQTTGAR